MTKSTNSNDASSVSALVCQSEGEKAALGGDGVREKMDIWCLLRLGTLWSFFGGGVCVDHV